MFSCMLNPSTWFSLLCIIPSFVVSETTQLNTTPTSQLWPSQQQQRNLRFLSRENSSTGTSKKGNFFFADVNTKIEAKVGEKVELPCLVYGLNINDVVVS